MSTFSLLFVFHSSSSNVSTIFRTFFCSLQYPIVAFKRKAPKAAKWTIVFDSVTEMACHVHVRCTVFASIEYMFQTSSNIVQLVREHDLHFAW